MKRVLIIAYYWPPNAGVGVYRWLKFTKYLPQFGWQPVVYTPENPELMAVDEALVKEVPPEAEVIKAPIIEPYTWYKRFTGKKSDERLQTAFLKEDGGGPTWKENVANWVRSNFFIPDARVWWVKPSVTRLLAYLKANPVDVIVTIAAFVVLIILMIGIGTFAKGGETNRKYGNRLMRYRIIAQAVAVILIVAFAWWKSQGAQ